MDPDMFTVFTRFVWRRAVCPGVKRPLLHHAINHSGTAPRRFPNNGIIPKSVAHGTLNPPKCNESKWCCKNGRAGIVKKSIIAL